MLLTDRFAGKIFTPNNFYTNFFGTETLTILFATVYGDRCFLYRTFSAQKCYAQKVLRTKKYIYTDVFKFRCVRTETNGTQKLLHTAHFYTQLTLARRTLLPLRDHLPFAFPFSRYPKQQWRSATQCKKYWAATRGLQSGLTCV